MAKQLNVNLAVRADTGQAKAQIQELQAILNKIMHTGSTTTLKGIDATKIQQAASAAKELQMHLNNAFNANTGKFDLSQLDKSLKASGSNITDLSTKLLNAGSTGQQAFMKLAQSISLADQPMLRINNKLNEFATTLKNTARWQLSSSMLHGFMGAVQSAYGYAQDLNESLTNIRIVTGQNAEQMAEFAEQANKAAKTLSTTTTDYTNASLIYYQQGLDDDEVIERTNVTIKMANAAGESAQTVSDQMTAVWNNFAKGGENLEYYADVMTALGAATASSTSEISEGLEKFASVAETVGLSYEYATSALATVTATTRQSADVVGTAFKTLFARIQDLELGKTLDDGTTLGQYSKALESVGVNIKDANGEIKDMDVILEEMAAKWQTLAKDQQVSLAQSVAGVRQYTQLIALMDNWDFMQENLETAYNSTGTLTEQAEIYAESWEAASKRVKASAEGLYQSLLDDDFFIDINNGFANMLTGLDSFIDGAGGLKTVIVGISSIIISNFANKIPEAIQTAKYNIDVLTKGSTQAYQNIQKDMQSAADSMFEKRGVSKESSLGFMVDSSNKLSSARTQLAQISERMSSAEKQLAETELNLMQQTQQETYAILQKQEALQSTIATMKEASLSKQSASFNDSSIEGYFRVEKAYESLSSYNIMSEDFMGGIEDRFQKIDYASNNLAQTLNDKLVNALSQLSTLKPGESLEAIRLDSEGLKESFNILQEAINQVDLSDFEGEDDIADAKRTVMDLIGIFPKAITESKSLKTAIESISKAKSADELKEKFNQFKEKLKDCSIGSEELSRALKQFQNPKDVENYINHLMEVNKLSEQAKQKIKAFNQSASNFQPTHIVRTSEALGSLAGLAGNAATMISSVSSAFKSLSNPNLSGWEKMSAVLMAFSFTVPTVISAMKGLGTVTDWVAMKNLEFITTQNLSNAVSVTRLATLGEVRAAELLTMAAEAKRAGSTKAEIVALITKNLTEKDGIDDTLAAAMAEEVAQRIEQGRTTSLAMLIGMKLTDIATTKAQNFTIGKYNVLMIIANALTSKFGMLWLGLGIGAIIAGVAGLVALIDKMNVTTEEANETMSESISKWKEAKSELESLNSELETTKDRIAELEAMDSLSIIEQEELDKLYEQEASLERQVALQEQLAKGERVKVADDFEDNFKALKRELSNNPEDTTRTFYDPSTAGYAANAGQEQLTLEQYKAKYIDSLYNEDGSIDENNVALAKQREEYYQQWLIDEEQSRAKWLAENQESLTNTEEGYLAWLEVNGDTATEDQKKEYAQTIQDSYKKGLGEEGYQDLVESQTKQSRKEEEERLGLSFGDIIDRDLAKEGATAESAAKNLANSFSESFKNELYSKGMVPEDYAQDLVDQVVEFEETINNTLSEAGSKLTLDQIKKDDRFKDEDLEILTKIKIEGDDDLNSIFEKIEQYKHNELVTSFDVQGWESEYDKKVKITSELEIGDSISAEDYAALGDAYENYFDIQSDGTAVLIRNAEELRDTINQIESEKMLNHMENQASQFNQVEEQTGQSFPDMANMIAQVDGGQIPMGTLGVEYRDHINGYIAAVEEAYGVECASIQEAMSVMSEHNAELIESQSAYYNTATSVSELRSRLSEVQEVLGYTDYNSYTDALIGLAASYENCSEEITEFQNALATGNEPLIAEKEHQLETAAAIGEASKEYGIEADVVEDVADGFLEMAEAGEEQYQILKEDAEALKDASVRYVRLQEALDDLNSNYDDYKDVLKDVQDSTNDVDRAMAANSKEGKNLQKSLAGLLGTTEDLIDADLLAAIDPKDFKKAAQGDEAAIERIRNAFVKLQAEANGIDFEGLRDELDGLEEGVVVDINADTMPLLYKLIEAKVAAGAGAAEIESLLSGMNIDADVSDFVGSMNEMAAASASASSEVIANTSFSQEVEATEVETPTTHEDVGFQENYTAVPITRKSRVLKDGAEEPIDVTETYYEWHKSVTPNKETETANDTQQAVSTKTTNGKGQTSQVKGVKISNAHKSSGGKVSGSRKGRSTGGKSGGGGGSKAKPEKVEKTKKSEVVERYKEIEDKLDDVRNSMEDASRAADRLYGKNRIKEMKKVSDSLEKEVKLLKDKRKEAEKYLQTDKTALKNAAKDAGISFKFDSEGNIKNYEDEMTKLYNRLAAAEKKAGPSNFKTKEAQDAYIEKSVTPLKEKIEALKEAISQYDETRELIEDLDDEAQEKFNEWQDNNFEILNYELELKLEVDDAELRKLEYLLSKIEDDFYSMAEAGALMIGNVLQDSNGNLELDGSGQLGVYQDRFEDLQDQRDALKESFQKGDISEAAYIEGLQNLEDQAYDNAEAIQDLDNIMMHYYGDTLEAAQEELSEYTDMMDQHVEVLEHYANVMDIIGKSTDYESMGEILEAQAEVAENNLAVSKANYQMLDEQRNQRKAEYEAAIGNATDEELAVLKQKWLDAEAAANDAQDEMMADAEAWAEALRAVVENKLAGLAQSLEKALTADFGGSFDQMSAQMERARDLQEEYLTDTNKIYETNKLINKAQQDIDKTTNTVAKKRLQNYIKETEQLQNKAKLSNYELEIQQAKYDLVLAEIALEEAQNAKSTVRLQRDDEGNFGYVYTADSSKVAEAEQQLADAQNRLYNIGLEGANDYTEKYQQTLAEMYDTLTELQTQYLEGAFASEEEYNTAVANAKEYYYAKLAQYSDLYTIALTTDSAVRVDAWSTDFDDMIYSTDKWQQSVNEYLGNVQSVFAEWETQVAKIREVTVGKDLDALKQKTKDIKDESKKLKDQIADPKDGVIKAIKDEIEEVNKLTNAYAKARKQIKGTQTDHENFIKELRESIENPDKDKKKEDSVVPKKEEEPKKEDPQPTTPKTDAIDYDKIKKGTKVEVKSGQKWYYDSYGISPTGTARDGTIKYINRDGTHPFNIEGLGWIKQSAIKKVVKYDTGGYTGSWGPQGKLAMLHEKELILNKHDTENFLASMDVLDRILQAIDLRAMSSQLGGILTSPTFGGQMKEEHLEQNVTIEANFPGVSMASEIEEAFENIVNLASQYANRK